MAIGVTSVLPVDQIYMSLTVQLKGYNSTAHAFALTEPSAVIVRTQHMLIRYIYTDESFTKHQ